MLVGSRSIQRWEQVRVLLVTVGMPTTGIVDPALSAVSLCSMTDEVRSFIPHLEDRLHHVYQKQTDMELPKPVRAHS